MKYTGFHRAMRLMHKEARSVWPASFGCQVDVEKADELRKAHRRAGLRPPTPTAMVVKAIALATRELIPKYPEINSMETGFLGWRTIHTFDKISAGVAVSRNEGGMDWVMLGMIDEPDKMSLTQITEKLRYYAKTPLDQDPSLRESLNFFNRPYLVQALISKLGEKLPGIRYKYRGTFNLTSLGMFGVDWGFAMSHCSNIQYGFGAIGERPVIKDGAVVPGRGFNLTLSFNHRIINGKPVAMLLNRARQILNNADFGESLPGPEPREQPMDSSQTR